ncbi:MAG: peptidylprolyl isomerase [Gammaproteobacteria bacterium]|nr:peptidylprolyl isomerase [Gammaproteobacteria bacterium]
MQFRTVLLGLSSACALAFTLSACNKNDDSNVGRPMPVSGKVIVTVNGVEIREQEVKPLLEGNGVYQGKEVTVEMLEPVIQQELMRQKAIAAGLGKDPEVAMDINRAATNTLVSKMVRQILKDNPPTQEEIQAIAQSQSADATQYHARHILVKDEALAKKLIGELKKKADFGKLAAQHSIDGSARRGGDLGWSTPSMYVPEFGAAMAQLKPGKITETPVKSQFGYHIIKLDEIRQVDTEQLVGMAQRALINKRIEDYLAKLKDGAKIEIVTSKLEAPKEAKEESKEENKKDAAAAEEKK